MLLALGALLLSLLVGSVTIAPGRLWTLLWHPDGSPHAQIVHQLRLPRTLSAFGVGAVLATGGNIGQGLSGISTLGLGSMVTMTCIAIGALAGAKFMLWNVMRD